MVTPAPPPRGLSFVLGSEPLWRGWLKVSNLMSWTCRLWPKAHFWCRRGCCCSRWTWLVKP